MNIEDQASLSMYVGYQENKYGQYEPPRMKRHISDTSRKENNQHDEHIYTHRGHEAPWPPRQQYNIMD